MSPRCKKPRICSCPHHRERGDVFKPAGIPLRDLETTTLGHDEMEAMYLCDSENLSQEEAGKRMGVSRGTVQRLVTQARKKIIESIVRGAAITVGHRENEGEPERRE